MPFGFARPATASCSFTGCVWGETSSPSFLGVLVGCESLGSSLFPNRQAGTQTRIRLPSPGRATWEEQDKVLSYEGISYCDVCLPEKIVEGPRVALPASCPF